MESVFNKLDGASLLLMIIEFLLNTDLSLNMPQMKSQSDAIPNINFEYSFINSLEKYEIPATPRTISMASETEQKRAIEKTCCLRMPCLKTKAFCAPIATINESPRKKPVKKALNKINQLNQ